MVAKRITLAVLLAALVIGSVACRPNIVGGDAGVYQNMTLYALANYDMGTVYAASVKALEQLEVDITSKAKDVFSAKVVGKAADGKTITITIKPRTEQTCELSIRVGTFGSKYRSGVIYEQIRKNLGTK